METKRLAAMSSVEVRKKPLWEVDAGFRVSTVQEELRGKVGRSRPR
jgi:hypothetical protein